MSIANACSYKRALARVYGEICLRCGVPMPLDQLTLDHVRPKSKGVSDDLGNLQLLCKDCNHCKGCNHVDYRPHVEPGELPENVAHKVRYDPGPSLEEHLRAKGMTRILRALGFKVDP